jgi:hypothetical protein
MFRALLVSDLPNRPRGSGGDTLSGVELYGTVVDVLLSVGLVISGAICLSWVAGLIYGHFRDGPSIVMDLWESVRDAWLNFWEVWFRR